MQTDLPIYRSRSCRRVWKWPRTVTVFLVVYMLILLTFVIFNTTSFTGSTLSAAMATAQGDIVTVTNAQSATASNLSSLESEVDTNTAAIATEQTARANGDSANATLITNLTAKVDTKNQTFIQDNAPADDSTNDLQDGDLWVLDGFGVHLWLMLCQW